MKRPWEKWLLWYHFLRYRIYFLTEYSLICTQQGVYLLNITFLFMKRKMTPFSDLSRVCNPLTKVLISKSFLKVSLIRSEQTFGDSRTILSMLSRRHEHGNTWKSCRWIFLGVKNVDASLSARMPTLKGSTWVVGLAGFLDSCHCSCRRRCLAGETMLTYRREKVSSRRSIYI